jgi:hypothetical protein
MPFTTWDGGLTTWDNGLTLFDYVPDLLGTESRTVRLCAILRAFPIICQNRKILLEAQNRIQELLEPSRVYKADKQDRVIKIEGNSDDLQCL